MKNIMALNDEAHHRYREKPALSGAEGANHGDDGLKDKKSTMETYWVPGVNNLKQYGRWAFAEFTEVYQIELDFANKVEAEFEKMLAGVCADAI